MLMQTKLHMFINCTQVKQFRKEFQNEYLEGEMYTEVQQLFGSEDKPDRFLLLEINRYIHQKNHINEQLNVAEFIARLKFIRRMEYEIADKNGVLIRHLLKWDNIAQKSKNLRRELTIIG